MTKCFPTAAMLKLNSQDNVDHLYTIPVEWEISYYDNEPRNNIVRGRSVTKLRCICGAEIDRSEHIQ